jgi:DNA transposition AAA+ family ATPase
MFTPADLIETIVDECAVQHIHLLVIDEAQKIDAANHDQTRQILDAARAREHALGLILIGTPPLRDLIIANGELGQRYSGYLAAEPLTLGDVTSHLASLHPDLPALRTTHGDAAWKLLVNDLHRTTGGSIRRLESILTNAHVLAQRRGAPLTLDVLEVAMDKLSPEN